MASWMEVSWGVLQPLGWILGTIYLQEEWWCIGTGGPGKVGSPSLGVFQSRGDVALRGVGSGRGGVGWGDDLTGLFQPQ